MQAALIAAAGQAPTYGDFADPVAAPGELRIKVAAAALSQLTRARAAGTHYSASGGFPLVPGVDGTGLAEDGRRLYFVLPRAPFGAMAQWSVAPEAHCVAVPEGLDLTAAAALANPGMSSWAALTERARFRPGETVLINGATGASGVLAVQIARAMGAGRVIATGRNRAVLEALGADATIVLTQDPAALQAAFAEHFAARVDVVLDYLWGPSAEALLAAAAKASPEGQAVRVVQIGNIGGASIVLPGAALRSSGLVLMGSGIGSVSIAGLLGAISGVFQAAAEGLLHLDFTPVPLADVARAWGDEGAGRVVFTL